MLAGDHLLRLAAKVAPADHFAGLAMLTLVALAQLVVTVAMIHVPRPGLPHLSPSATVVEAAVAVRLVVTTAHGPLVVKAFPGQTGWFQRAGNDHLVEPDIEAACVDDVVHGAIDRNRRSSP